MSDLPAGWSRGVLGDVALVSTGGTPDRSQPRYWNGDVPWVTTGEIRFNTITDTAERITREGLDASAARLLPPGTLLMAMYGQGRTRGQVARLGMAAATNQACAAIQVQPGTDVDYVYQFLVSRYAAIRALGNAGTQQNLNTGIIRRIALPLPPLAEQQRIAQIAATWDRAIDTVGALLENHRRQTQDLMVVLLGGQRRIPGTRSPWAHVDFESVFERITRRNAEDERNVLTISAQHGLVSQRDYFSKSVASEDLRHYTRLTSGDFAYNKSASSGYPMGAIKPLLAHDSGVVSSLYICFRHRPGIEVDPDFYRLYFEAGMLNDALTGIVQEGARSHGMLNISVRDFFKLPLAVPPVEEQRRIAGVLRVAEAQERTIATQREALKAEKHALMKDLLAGRRRVRKTPPGRSARSS